MNNNKTNAGKKGTVFNKVSLLLLVYDVIAVNISCFLALLLRFDFTYSEIPVAYLSAFIKFAPFYTFIYAAIFALFHLYNSIWKYASASELTRIIYASLILAAVQYLGMTLFVGKMPLSYFVVSTILQAVLSVVPRFGIRYIHLERRRLKKKQTAVHNAMVIGAGEAGQVIIRELKNSDESDAIPLCIIDDDRSKWGKLMEGIPVAGGRDSILEAVKKYNIDRILFAIPTADAETKREILNICNETDCTLLSLPGIYQLANGEVSLSRMKPVAVEDLLGRDPIKVDMAEIFANLRDKTILVTGGGGSIGSELCRQIAGHSPNQLIIFDIYENNAYDIEQELRRKYPELNLVVLIGSVRDTRRIESVFETYRPDYVFHAAAHKHVPLMETSPNESIKNNVVGTYKTACAALKYGTKRFVLISTDKAVNPTNIMGASKRLCEMVIQSMDAISREGRDDLLVHLHAHADGYSIMDPVEEPINTIHLNTTDNTNTNRTRTQFVAVRFGNVLGSNGSVIPLFKKQIEAGGPVCVTHPDIIRYFMTIPEAVSLVLQAGTYAHGGEIFILDMGSPVKIDTLARNLIRLSGYKPDEDIKIVYTGLRPGEKLYEEKLMSEEGLLKTDNKLIHIGKPLTFDVNEFMHDLRSLAIASYSNAEDIIERVEKMVPTFHHVKN